MTPDSLPTPGEQAKEIQAYGLTLLREVFAARKDMGRKQARGASTVCRVMGTQLRALELSERE